MIAFRHHRQGDRLAHAPDCARTSACRPAGSGPDRTTDGGIESQIGALGISASGRASTAFMRSAATSSSLTASAIRLDCIGKKEIRLSGELPAMLAERIVAPAVACRGRSSIRLFQSKRPLSSMYLPLGCERHHGGVQILLVIEFRLAHETAVLGILADLRAVQQLQNAAGAQARRNRCTARRASSVGRRLQHGGRREGARTIPDHAPTA